MANDTSGTLDSNVKDANDVGMALTTEKQITLIVHNGSGAHDNHQTGLEMSDDPTGNGSFVDVPGSLIVGSGIITVNHGAGYVKAKVFKPEGAASEVNVAILAR